MCPAHKTLESTTKYYSPEFLMYHQNDAIVICKLPRKVSLRNQDEQMSAKSQTKSVYSSLNYILTHNHAVVTLNKNSQMGCWVMRTWQKQGEQHSSCDEVVVQFNNDLSFTSSQKLPNIIRPSYFAVFHQHGVMECFFKI